MSLHGTFAGKPSRPKKTLDAIQKSVSSPPPSHILLAATIGEINHTKTLHSPLYLSSEASIVLLASYTSAANTSSIAALYTKS